MPPKKTGAAAVAGTGAGAGAGGPGRHDEEDSIAQVKLQILT
jgi:hypothetical protein